MPEQGETQPKIALPIAVIGGGPVGMLASLQLAALGYEVLLIAAPPKEDKRTTALMMPSIRFLTELGVWDDTLRHQAGLLATMRIIDASKRLIRAPTVSFQAQEIGQTAFGYNIPNTYLNRALHDKIAAEPRIERLNDTVQDYHHHDTHMTLTRQNGSKINAKLIIAADGRMSGARQAAQIETRQWGYPQHALVLSFTHQLPHHNTSNEFHTEQGPFTQVPLPGNCSSLVWVVKPDVAQSLLNNDSQKLAKKIEMHMHAMLGKVTIQHDKNDWPPQSWPMGGTIPTKFAANRTILIGEAAHVFPPIGAQGLNLGIRDVMGLGIVLKKALEDTRTHNIQDLNIPQIMDAYNRHRRSDIWLRTGLVHGLNRLLLADFLPLQLLRCGGLEMLRQFTPLRSLFMREGLTPGAGIRALLPHHISYKDEIP